jgi:hypothetical protein
MYVCMYVCMYVVCGSVCSVKVMHIDDMRSIYMFEYNNLD